MSAEHWGLNKKGQLRKIKEAVFNIYIYINQQTEKGEIFTI